jgi:hypothetical protein
MSEPKWFYFNLLLLVALWMISVVLGSSNGGLTDKDVGRLPSYSK